MSLTPTPHPQDTAATPTAAAVIGRIRRLLILSVLVAIVFPAFMSGTRGLCPGGPGMDGGFIDASGRSVDEAPMCVQLTLGPSPLLYLGIAVIVVLAVGRVGKAVDRSAALRTLDRAAIGVCALVVAAIVISQVWFQLIPLEGFTSGSWSVFSPFPFGVIDVDVTPMTSS